MFIEIKQSEIKLRECGERIVNHTVNIFFLCQ